MSSRSSGEGRPRSTTYKKGDVPNIQENKIRLRGFLTKEGGSWKSWKRRYFILSVDGILNYYEDEEMTKPKGTLDCTEADICLLPDEGGLFFEIATRKIATFDSGRRLKLQADNEDQMLEWIQAIRIVSCMYGDKDPAGSEFAKDTADSGPMWDGSAPFIDD